MGLLPILGSALIGAIGSSKAAGAQKDASKAQIDYSKETRDLVFGKLQPFVDQGYAANNALAYELGIGAPPTNLPAYNHLAAATGGGTQQPAPTTSSYTPPKIGVVDNGAKWLGQTSENGDKYWINMTEGENFFDRVYQDQMPSSYDYTVGDQTFGTRDEAQSYVDTLIAAEAAKQQPQTSQPAQTGNIGGQIAGAVAQYTGQPVGSLGQGVTPTSTATVAPDVGGERVSGFTKQPGYDFWMQEGQDAIQASAAARGNLLSGATLEALQQGRMDYATGQYNNWLNRLSGLESSGQSAAAGQGSAAMQINGQVNNALANQGNAAAAGWIGGTNAIQQGIGNWLGYQQFNKLMAA